jgi:hypothetical protein
MYGPLDASKYQIRLLHLLPGELDAKLSCTFSVASLDDDPEYEAASYVWGSWNNPGNIEVGTTKAVVWITKNLHSVLRNVRFPDRSRTLWVDALCINQQDLGERGSQVGMMARVYEQAKCVLAYLGDHYEGCERAIDVIHRIAHDPALHLLSKPPTPDVKVENTVENTAEEQHQHECPMHSSNLNKTQDIEAFTGVGLEDPELLEHLLAFLDTPWMTRVWTVQEFTCAKEITLLYGRTAISGEETLKFCRHRSEHSPCCSPKSMSQTWVTFSAMANNWNSLQRARAVGQISYVQVLECFRIRNAGDQRDKVYSLLGLGHPSWAELVPPDYTITTEQTYMRAVIADCRCDRLDFLSFCHARDSPGIRCNALPPCLNLPSWVPDWSVPTTDLFTNNALFMLNVGYRAHGGREADLEIDLPDSLTALGVTISTVSFLTDPLMWSSNNHEAVFTALQEIQYTLQLNEHHEEIYGRTDRTLAQAFCLAVIGGMQCDPSTREYKRLSRSGNVKPELFKAWTQGRNHPIFPLWNIVFHLTAKHRHFMRLENGYFGFAHEDCQVGDVIVALGGGRVPYILRPLPTGNYTVIGTSYVQDMMDGEAFEMGKEPEKITMV